VTVAGSSVAFAVGAVVSLATSWLLVSRLERIGKRVGMSEALLGVVAALAADAPEITASITALSHHQHAVGTGVTIGSNVFNLAALLGLGAVVAGRIDLHRKVVVLGGAIGLVIGVISLGAVTGAVSIGVALALALVVFVPYVAVLALVHFDLSRFGVHLRWARWLTEAVEEEESELEPAIHPPRGTPVDLVVAVAALIIVVAASVAMEMGASTLGTHFGVPEIVTGALVLAAVTSLPNAVAAIYLARRGLGAATWSTSLNSNVINIIAGFLLPAFFIGLSSSSASGLLVVSWYVGLTAVVVGLAYAGRGLGRLSGWLIMALYGAFVIALLAIA
jgi:cation:H+ antiporter